MRPAAVFAAVALHAAPVFAAEPPAGAGGFSLAAGFIQMAASLAVVIGVIMVFHYLSRRWLRGSAAGGRPGYIRVVENRFLAPKKSLMLVEVGGEYMLLGNCGDSITLIKQIDMIEEIEIVSENTPAAFQEALQEKLKSLAARFPLATGSCPAPAKKGGVRL